MHPIAIATMMFALRAVHNKGELLMPVGGGLKRDQTVTLDTVSIPNAGLTP